MYISEKLLRTCEILHTRLDNLAEELEYSYGAFVLVGRGRQRHRLTELLLWLRGSLAKRRRRWAATRRRASLRIDFEGKLHAGLTPSEEGRWAR
jgi:hypothetical protein